MLVNPFEILPSCWGGGEGQVSRGFAFLVAELIEIRGKIIHRSAREKGSAKQVFSQALQSLWGCRIPSRAVPGKGLPRNGWSWYW